MRSRVVVEPASSGASIGRTDTVRCYIAGQQAHHRKLTFPEEFLALLKAHQIEYEERYLLEMTAVFGRDRTVSVTPAGFAPETEWAEGSTKAPPFSYSSFAPSRG